MHKIPKICKIYPYINKKKTIIKDDITECSLPTFSDGGEMCNVDMQRIKLDTVSQNVTNLLHTKAAIIKKASLSFYSQKITKKY